MQQGKARTVRVYFEDDARAIRAAFGRRAIQRSVGRGQSGVDIQAIAVDTQSREAIGGGRKGMQHMEGGFFLRMAG